MINLQCGAWSIFDAMVTEELSCLVVEQKALASVHLKRYVIIDCYLPKNIKDPNALSLLLLNDGQNLDEMPFSKVLNDLLQSNGVVPLFCVGIHAGKDRKNEYGTALELDYEGRGTKAKNYQRFILEELIPFIHAQYAIESFQQKGFAGFSLGGLSAMDISWHHPDIFSIAGIFSGSLWWRNRDVHESGYDDQLHRIMHSQVREGAYFPQMRFYFTTGSMDETADRNGNGIIDSIDDTVSLIEELKNLGYTDGQIRYINYEDGKHDIATWARALPQFLLWGWAKSSFGIPIS